MPWPFRPSPEKRHDKGITEICGEFIAANFRLTTELMEGWDRIEDAPDLHGQLGVWVNWRTLSYLLWRCEEAIHNDLELPQRHADKLAQDVTDRTIERFIRHAYSGSVYHSEDERRKAKAVRLEEFCNMHTEDAAHYGHPAEPYPIKEVGIRPRPGAPTPDWPWYRLLRDIERTIGIPLADRVWAHTSRVMSLSIKDLNEDQRTRGLTLEDVCTMTIGQVDQVDIRKILKKARVIEGTEGRND